MKFVDTVRSWFAGAPSTGSRRQDARPRHAARSLAAALPGIGADDIGQMSDSANQVIRAKLSRMRRQSRYQALNSDYVKAFLRMVEHHVVGSDGVRMQNKARDFNGQLDNMAC